LNFKKTLLLNKKDRFLLLFCVQIIFISSFSFASQEGELNFSLWNRNYFRNSEFSNENVYETLFHLDFSQVYTNYGKITGWVDGLFLSEYFDKIARWFLNWSDLKLGTFSFKANAGDDFFQFTNLESRFINTFHPYLYYRGANLSFSTSRWEMSVWGGKKAQLSGLLGSTYELTDQPLFGFRSKYRFKEKFLLGMGFIHTENETDDTGKCMTERNDIFLMDSQFDPTPWLSVLGEIRGSFSLQPEETSRKKGSFLRLGPIIRTEKLNLEANYRYVGTDYRFLSRDTQIEEDEKGIFSTFRYRISKSFSIFGTIDRFQDNVANDPQKNTVHTFQVFSGFSLFPESFPSITTRFETTNRKSKKDFPDAFDHRTTGIYAQISKRITNFYPYFRLIWNKTNDRIFPERDFTSLTQYLGFRRPLRRTSSLWIEGVMKHQWNSVRQLTMRTASLRAGIRLHLSPRFTFNSEAFYNRLKTEKTTESIELYLGLNCHLPWEMMLNLDFKSNLPLTKERKDSTYWITIKLTKGFKWGAPVRILGKIPGEAVRGVGNIEGFIFADTNQNMILDAQDKGIAGIRVKLEDHSFISSDENGKYRFSNVAEGRHTVTIEHRKIPAQFYMISPIQMEVLVMSRKTHEADFILVQGSHLSGKVFDDANRNGKFDTEEKGLPNILILLKPLETKAEWAARYLQDMVLNTYTDSEGNYVFDNIFPAVYEIHVDEESLPEGRTIKAQHPEKIILQPGQKIENKDFSVVPKPIRIRRTK
jgi:hypothetical protein